jgi:hypothetical protein
MMTSAESKTGIVARAVVGVVAAVALTVGAAVGVAAELERGFEPAYTAMNERQVTTRPQRALVPAPASPVASRAAHAARGVPQGS